MSEKRAFLLSQQWYIRKEGIVTGPFSGTVVRRWIGVGRVTATDEISVDQTFWAPVHDYPELFPQRTNRDEGELYQQEREQAAVRWEDERTGVDRRDRPVYGTVPPSGNRSGQDRRILESPEAIDHRDHRRGRRAVAGADRAAAPQYRKQTVLLVAVIALSGVAAVMGLWFLPSRSVDISPDCAMRPSPGINLNDCKLDGRDFRGANLDGASLRGAHLLEARLDKARLSRADLSYAIAVGANLRQADLRSALLVGADLRLSDLTHANLAGADLRYANLADASLSVENLSNAQLGKAIWIDGRLCAAQSVGRCSP